MKYLSLVFICVLVVWQGICIKDIYSLKNEVKSLKISTYLNETQYEFLNNKLNTEIIPVQQTATANLVRMKAQIESFDIYISHDKNRRAKIFHVRDMIKKIIWKTKKTQIFEEGRKLTNDEIYKIAMFVVDYCDQYGVPVNLYLGLLRQESAFNPYAKSETGAMGLSQIVPSTARAIAHQLHVEDYDMYNIQDNIRFGVYYLHTLLDTFSNESLALQAYNAGPNFVQRWLHSEVMTLPTETVEYEKRIHEFAANYASAGIY
jgi:Transglycosylase SLT domain